MGLRKACSAISGLSLVFLSLVVAAPSDATSIAIAESVQLTTITANDQWIPQFQTFDGVEMALVPPGCFLMGSTGAQVKEAIERLSSFYATSAPPWISAETPQNKVCFTQGYWIDSGLVTRDQFKSLGGRTAKSAPDNSQKEVSPVVQITWFEARDFCVKRGGRLPTEAEWEYAARGPDDLIYPGGNTIIYTGPHSPPTVGASWVGVINMAGGEWQWVSSIFKSYPFDMNDGRESGSDIKSLRVLRGGTAALSLDGQRAARRFATNPADSGDWAGFRCARSLSASDLVVISPTRPIGVKSNKAWTPEFQSFNGVEMAQVPSGCFTMGTADPPLPRYNSEQPTTKLCFDKSFWIDRTEVTQAQFKMLEGKVASTQLFIGVSQPVEQITWFEARDFCAKRGGRLPTEAEWEYAARGPDNLIYPWGNTFDGNKVVLNSTGTADVGSKPQGVSWIGALDMSGNVWEWTGSIDKPYPYYASQAQENSELASKYMRVSRGGGFSDVPNDLRTATRYALPPFQLTGEIGFRCVRDS